MIDLLEKQLFAIRIDKEKYENLRAIYTDIVIHNATDHIKRAYHNYIIQSEENKIIEQKISEVLENKSICSINDTWLDIFHSRHDLKIIDLKWRYNYDYNYEDYYNIPSNSLINIVDSKIITYNNLQFKVYYHIYTVDETQDKINGFSGGDESIIAQPIEYEYIFIRV